MSIVLYCILGAVWSAQQLWTTRFIISWTHALNFIIFVRCTSFVILAFVAFNMKYFLILYLYYWKVGTSLRFNVVGTHTQSHYLSYIHTYTQLHILLVKQVRQMLLPFVLDSRCSTTTQVFLHSPGNNNVCVHVRVYALVLLKQWVVDSKNWKCSCCTHTHEYRLSNQEIIECWYGKELNRFRWRQPYMNEKKWKNWQ